MLHDVSRDKKYVRKYDPKTQMLHVYARGAPIPACVDTKNDKAMDWDEVFPKQKDPIAELKAAGLYFEHELVDGRCRRCGCDFDGSTRYSCFPPTPGELL